MEGQKEGLGGLNDSLDLFLLDKVPNNFISILVLERFSTATNPGMDCNYT